MTAATVPPAPSRRAAPMRLSRRFALMGFPIALIGSLILLFAYREVALLNQRVVAENALTAVNRMVLNRVWPLADKLAGSADAMPLADIRGHAATQDTLAALRALAADTPVLKVKLFDKSGFAVFSTDLAEIGGNSGGERGFRAALQGKQLGERSYRKSFASLNGPVRNVEVLATYMPVHGAGGDVAAVMQIYADVTAIFREPLGRAPTIAVVGFIAATMIAVFLVQWSMVSAAERRIDRQRARNAHLRRGVADAKAASRAKSDFIAGVTHELRTPLHAIIGFSELMRTETVSPIGIEQFRAYADEIYKAGSGLLVTINRVLDMMKIESGRLQVSAQEIDAATTVEYVLETVRPAAESKRLALSCTCGEGLPYVHTDAKILQQVLLNLLSNAVKFTPEGGTVAVTIAAVDAGSWLEIAVADTGIGIGIKPEDVPQALSSYGQVDNALSRRFDGLGLGLPLSVRFTELLGGKLSLESTPGVGTTVRVRLPLRDGEPLAGVGPVRGIAAAA